MAHFELLRSISFHVYKLQSMNICSEVHGYNFNINKPLTSFAHSRQIAKLVDIRHEPLVDFSKAIWNASKLVSNSKFELEIILLQITLSNSHKSEIPKFFQKVEQTFDEMEDLSDSATINYEELTSTIKGFISDTKRMKRVTLLNL